MIIAVLVGAMQIGPGGQIVKIPLIGQTYFEVSRQAEYEIGYSIFYALYIPEMDAKTGMQPNTIVTIGRRLTIGRLLLMWNPGP